MLRKSTVVVVILLFLFSSVIPITNSYETNKVNTIYLDEDGTLSGYVKDTSMNPIEGVRVRVFFHDTYEENFTDSAGYYHITNIPICWCMKNATASKEGYKTIKVLLSIDETTTYYFVLPHLDKILYVGGNGPNNYTRIQDAVDNANNGDTIFVYNGIYSENIHIFLEGISLIGENRNNTIISGDGRSGIYISANWINITGFTITNCSNGIGLWNCSYNTFIGNRLFNNHIGIQIMDGDGISVINNVISNNEGGIQVQSSVNINVSNNLISNNSNGILYHDVGDKITKNVIKDAVFITKSNGLIITENNFIDHRINIHFVKPNNISWNGNYWENWRTKLPRPILGIRFLSVRIIPIIIPAIDFDWHPATEPYDISIPEVS